MKVFISFLLFLALSSTVMTFNLNTNSKNEETFLSHFTQYLMKYLGTQSHPHNPNTVPYVDLDRFMGTWYEQGHMPFLYERGCSNSNATYYRESSGKIKIDTECQKDGKKAGMVATIVPSDSTGAKLQIHAGGVYDLLGMVGHQWIVRLADDYSYMVVSAPSENHLWIYSRSKEMSEQLYIDLVQDLKKDGFPVEKLIRNEIA